MVERYNCLELIYRCGKWQRMGVFLCDCGNVKAVSYWKVKIGRTKSCSCLRRKEAADGKLHCHFCGEFKLPSAFFKDSTSKTGHARSCRDCAKSKCKERVDHLETAYVRQTLRIRKSAILTSEIIELKRLHLEEKRAIRRHEDGTEIH